MLSTILLHKGDLITITHNGETVSGRVRQTPPLGSIIQIDIETTEPKDAPR